MQEEGIVVNYNGFTGKIKNVKDEEYLLLKKDIADSYNLKVNDKVVFTPDIYKTVEYQEKVARFIRKLEK